MKIGIALGGGGAKGIAHIYPNVQGIGLMDFDMADECLAAGEQAARAALPQIDQVIRAPRWRYQSQKLIERIRFQFAARSA